MKFLRLIAWLLNYNLALVSFAAGFLSEDVVFFLVILSGAGFTDLGIIAAFGFLGVIFHDSIIYLLANSQYVKKLKSKINFSERNRKIIKEIEKFGRRNYFLTLLFSKFIYGTRIAIIFYINGIEKDFRKFSFHNTIAVFIWFSIMVPVGWLAGQGFSELFRVINGLERILIVVLVLIVAVYLIKNFINRKISKKIN